MSKKGLNLILGILPVAVILIFVLLAGFLRSDAYSGIKFSEEKDKKHIYLDGDEILADEDDSLKVHETQVIIYQGGTYCFEGKLNDGQIIVNAGNEEKVTIRLDGVDIHCEDGSPLWIKNAGKLVLKLKKDTENHLSDGADYSKVVAGEKQPNACIYSRADLVIKTSAGVSEDSEGILRLEGNHKNGIACSEDIRVKAGDIQITAVDTAIKAKEDLTVTGGRLTLTSDHDGIYCEENVSMQGQSLAIDAGRYGVFGRLGVEISDDCQTEFLNVISRTASCKKE